MALTRVDSNGWAFVQGVTGDNSSDAVGLASNVEVLREPGGNGVHIAGGYRSGRSNVILKSFYDALNGSTNDVGYVQTVETLCLDVPTTPRNFPGLAGRLGYTRGDEPAYLDFMGPADARARFAGTPANAPFCPFDAFMRLELARFDAVYFHPMPHGSLRPADGYRPRPEATPDWNDVAGQPSRAASVRTVVRPFLLREEQFASICTDAGPTLFQDWDAEIADAESAYELARRMYDGEPGGAFPQIVDAIAAGAFLVLVTKDYDAIVVRIGDRTGPAGGQTRAVRIWEIDHDAFESIEHAAAMETLRQLDAGSERLTMYRPMSQIPSGRGWSNAAQLPRLAFARGPAFSMIFTATAAEWLRPRATRGVPHTRPRFLSSVRTRIDWTYDPMAEDFDVTINRPTMVQGLDGWAPTFWDRYQQVVYGAEAPAGEADSVPFYLAGMPWLDDAPTLAGNRG